MSEHAEHAELSHTPDEALLQHLPDVYAVALRLSAHGADRRVIAVALGIGADAVDATLAIARRKLADLTGPPPT